MNIIRKWAMPNKNTFSIKPINQLITKYALPNIESVDPFSNINRIAKYCNDIDPQYMCDYSLDAIDFLKIFNKESIDLVLFDPPYSPRQLAECYNKLDKSVTIKDTSAEFWSLLKKQISVILKPGGICISLGWNSNGIGKQYMFEIIELLIVPHGGMHNDTICTVEKKFKPTLF